MQNISNKESSTQQRNNNFVYGILRDNTNTAQCKPYTLNKYMANNKIKL